MYIVPTNYCVVWYTEEWAEKDLLKYIGMYVSLYASVYLSIWIILMQEKIQTVKTFISGWYIEYKELH